MTVAGVVFRPQSPPEELLAVARRADASGVAELWLWEDCFLEGGLTTAAMALAATERLHVGVGLLPVPLRNAAITAMEIATLARAFPGRLWPGLGHGVQAWMEQVGARAVSPLTLLREHVDAVRRLLHGDTVNAYGRYVTLDAVALDWPPAPADVPSLLVGARGPRTVELAGEVGDGTILDASATLDDVRRVRGVVDAASAAAGRTGHRLVVFAEVPAARQTAASLREAVAAYADAGADAVAFQGPGDEPDCRRLIDALASR